MRTHKRQASLIQRQHRPQRQPSDADSFEVTYPGERQSSPTNPWDQPWGPSPSAQPETIQSATEQSSATGLDWNPMRVYPEGQTPPEPLAWPRSPGNLIQRAPAEAPAKDTVETHPTLMFGSTGASVQELQTKLNGKGTHPPLKVDGIFGPKTRKGVTDFQATHKDTAGQPLKVDGIVGQLTWGALDQVSPVQDAVPLAADELILSLEPEHINNAGLLAFRTRVGSTVMAWGLPFTPDAVQLKLLDLDQAETPAVVLKWDAAWENQPISPSIPASLAPIDARTAVAGVHQLAGWNSLANGDQTILNHMLGGETNQLSQTTRDYLRPQFPDLTIKPAVEQQQALEGLITGKDAIPAVVDEPVTTAKIDFVLVGPVEKQNYAFQGKTADAEEWTITFADAVQFVIIAPKAPEPGHHNHTVQQTADAASYLPRANRAVINTILLNAVTNPDDPYWAGEYNRPNFHSYMTAGAAGIVTIYPDKTANSLPDDNYMRGTMIHETGHTWSRRTWGDDETQGKWVEWKQAMDQDKVSVSGYAQASIAEDVAETIQIYVSTQGTPRFDEYRQIVPHRFDMLDKEYQ